jgi:hypothetical protein
MRSLPFLEAQINTETLQINIETLKSIIMLSGASLIVLTDYGIDLGVGILQIREIGHNLGSRCIGLQDRNQVSAFLN